MQRLLPNEGVYVPLFSEKSVLYYILQQDKDNCSLAVLSQIEPALTLVESLSGVKKSAFSETVDIMLTAANVGQQNLSPLSVQLLNGQSHKVPRDLFEIRR